ncbi:MAG: hypothetical protein R2702_13305 [Acidimicrobiales bacterium]
MTAPEGFVRLDDRAKGWARATWRRWIDEPGRAAEAAVSFLAVLLSTAIILVALKPSDLFSGSTPTGGDMGAHLWGPRFLIDHLLPHWRLSGWTPDWYDGFPAYQFYMVVPSLFVVALHVGLPWYLQLPVLFGASMAALVGWWYPRWHRFRWPLTIAGAVVAVLAMPIPYNQAFKLVTASGLLTLPLACWFLAKAAKLPFPTPALAAGGGLLFVFNLEPLYNNTGNIIGGNFTSTMAGEFAFSISLTLSIVYLGVAVRGLRTGRHRALAAVLFALAGLCHLIPAFFVLVCTGALFLVHPDRGRFRWLATMVPVAGLLTAFWVLPFLLRHAYVNDMGWERLPLPNGEETSVWYYLLPHGLRYLFAMAVVGILFSIVRRHAVGLVLAVAWAAVWVAFASLPQMRLWNARLLPFMYLSASLLAAIGLGELLRVIAGAASGDARRPLRLDSVGGSALSIALILLYTLLPLNGVLDGVITREPVTSADGTTKTRSSFLFFDTTHLHPALGWSGNNYSGLEAKAPRPGGCDQPGSAVACTSGGFPEYRALVATMDGIGKDDRYGCGRAMWEYSKDRLEGYGTPMALMMLPYFTNGCIGSQEGLYFESSATVPYHFLMQAELSAQGSNPQRDLPYPGFDIDAGVRHLQLLGVKYYLATSTTAVDQASRHPDLTEIAVSGAWHVYEVADAPEVAPLRYEPVVATGIDETQDGWLPTASAWFRQSDEDVLIAAHGPDAWARTEADPVPADDRRLVRWVRDQLGRTGPIDQVPELPKTELPEVEVSDIEMGTDTISFHVSKPGVPVLVKASYFPNWEVEGAEGPYRVTPNLMVVIPTDTDVSMHFGRTPVDLVAALLTLLGIVGVVLLARNPQVAVTPEREPRLSQLLDRLVTIPAVAAANDAAARGEAPATPSWPEPPVVAVDGPPPAEATPSEPDAEGIWVDDPVPPDGDDA